MVVVVVVVVSSEACHVPPEVIWAVAVVAQPTGGRSGGVALLHYCYCLSCPASPSPVTGTPVDPRYCHLSPVRGGEFVSHFIQLW